MSSNEQRYHLGQEVFTIDEIQRVKSFVIGAACITNNGVTIRKILYAPQTYENHSWTSQELLYPNKDEAIKAAISTLKSQL